MEELIKRYLGKPATKPYTIEEGVLFSVYAPEARNVYIAGDFNGWNSLINSLTRGEDGVWRIILKLRGNRNYEYKYVVDGNWILDPNNENKIEDVAGGYNSIIYLNEKGETYEPNEEQKWKLSPEGRNFKAFYLKTKDEEVYNYWVYVPKGKEKKYPVVIALNGYLKSQWLHLYLEKYKMIGVVPEVKFGFHIREWQKLNLFEKLLEVLYSEFPIREDSIFIMGMSNGAIEVIKIACAYPDKIAGLSAIMGYYDLGYYKKEIEEIEGKAFINWMEINPHIHSLKNLGNVNCYLSHGGLDLALPASESELLYMVLKKIGARCSYKYYPEHGHSWLLVDDDLETTFDWFSKSYMRATPSYVHYFQQMPSLRKELYSIKYEPEESYKDIDIHYSKDNSSIRLELKNISKIAIGESLSE